MKLLVGSVFVNDSPIQQKWLDLQLKFLGDTVGAFDYTGIVWKKESDFFNKIRLLELECPYRDSEAHAYGLTHLLHHFRERAADFDHFLLLDGDAFPIRMEWLSILTQCMGQCEIAVPIRTENLELRLHPSVIFIKSKAALDKLIFRNGPVGMDLLGNLEHDHFLPSYQHENRHLSYPLLRSNGYNVHPLACGIYYDMFYHHCCGAGHGFLARKDGYWKTIGQYHEANMWQFTRELMDEPQEFINRLRGNHG